MLNIRNPAGSGITSIDGDIYFTDTSGIAYRVTAEGATSTYDQGEGVQGVEIGPVFKTSTPAVKYERVFVGGLDDTLYAIDLESGKTEWEVKTKGAVRSQPVVTNGVVYAACFGGDVYATDRETGEELWQYQVGSPVISSPCYAREQLIVATQTGEIHTIDAASGEGDLVVNLGEYILASPIVNNGTVYIAMKAGALRAISLQTDEVLWDRSLDEPVTATPALTDDSLYVGTHEGTLVAIDGATGATNWQTEVQGSVQTGLGATENALLAGTDAGEVHAVEPGNGETLWTFEAGSPVVTPLSVAADLLYFGTKDASIYALTSDASLLYSIQSFADIASSESSAAIPKKVPPVHWSAGVIGTVATATYAGFRLFGKRRSNEEPAASNDVMETGTALSGEATPIRTESHSDTAANLSLEGISYSDFEQKNRIGSGGTADVYEAKFHLNGTMHTVAVKTPQVADNDTVDATTFTDFIEEAEVWDSIDDHERIVTIYGWGTEPLPWIAMEYMEGGTLQDNQGELSVDDMFVELEGLCDALHHAHRRGVTHTDIKPENILYTEPSPNGTGKFTDWGLANVLLEHSMSVYGLTPEYSAPEQLQPEDYGGTDDRTDIYQLGVVAFELFTGELPYQGTSHGGTIKAILNAEPPSPSELNPDLPENLDAVLLKAISEQKDDRYETALHFRDDIRRAYTSL
jgi:outer membrane protein assembly factor BamB/tRNA A-37 threonylcarbamoyl transferase component Bud32